MKNKWMQLVVKGVSGDLTVHGNFQFLLKRPSTPKLKSARRRICPWPVLLLVPQRRRQRRAHRSPASLRYSTSIWIC